MFYIIYFVGQTHTHSHSHRHRRMCAHSVPWVHSSEWGLQMQANRSESSVRVAFKLWQRVFRRSQRPHATHTNACISSAYSHTQSDSLNWTRKCVFDMVNGKKKICKIKFSISMEHTATANESNCTQFRKNFVCTANFDATFCWRMEIHLKNSHFN